MKDQSQYTFEDQRPDEEVVFVQKRHPWVFSKAGLVGMGLIVLLVLSFLFFGFSLITSLLIVLMVIFVLSYGSYLWFCYNNYLYILTDQRLIIIEQQGLFSRKITESELDKFQNVTVEVKGPIKTFLNFGNIKITTAGIDPVMILENVESPYEVQQQIIKYSKNISSKIPREKTIIR